jgi:hypothetical protein
MKKTLFSFSVIALLLLTLASCKKSRVKGHGPIGDETRNVAAFTGIDIAVPLDIEIVIDSNASGTSITLNGYKNLLSHIRSEVKNNMLYIKTEKRLKMSTDRDIRLTLTMPSLSYFKIAGSGDANIVGDIKTDKLELVISGAGDLQLGRIYANNLIVNLSGVGDLSFKGGNVSNAEYRVSGAGEIDADKLISDNVKASVSGVGDIAVNAAANLDARINGAGNISYTGHPAITKRISGIGHVEDAN